MPFFVWSDDKLSLQVSQMDKEHKVLVEIMNSLFDRNEAKAPKSELQDLVDKLAAFTVKHFQNEEAYMASISFPSLETHKIIHKQLLARFGTFVDEFKLGDGKISAGFFGFLNGWLTAHICGIDKKYADHSRTHFHSQSHAKKSESKVG